MGGWVGGCVGLLLGYRERLLEGPLRKLPEEKDAFPRMEGNGVEWHVAGGKQNTWG